MYKRQVIGSTGQPQGCPPVPQHLSLPYFALLFTALGLLYLKFLPIVSSSLSLTSLFTFLHFFFFPDQLIQLSLLLLAKNSNQRTSHRPAFSSSHQVTALEDGHGRTDFLHAYIYEIQVSYISYIYAFSIYFFRGIVQALSSGLGFCNSI